MEFKEYKLSEIGKIYSGGTPSTKVVKYWNGKIPWITPKDLSNNSNKFIENGSRSITEEGLKNSSAFIIPKNSVLMSSRAPIGYIVMNRIEVTTNQGFKSLHTDEDICLNEYFYYWLKNNIDNIKNNANGSTFKEISGNEFSNLIIDLPSLENQNKIVKILSDIDKKIEINEKIINNLMDIACNSIKENKKVKSISLNYIVDFKKGRKPSVIDSKKFKNSIKYMTIGVINNKEKLYGLNEKVEIIDNNILMLMDGAGSGNVYFEKEGIVASTMSKIIIKDNNFFDEYVYFILKINEKFVKSKNTGSAIPHVDKNFSKEIKVPIIGKDKQSIYVYVAKKIILLKEENQNFIKMKEILLPKLLNGKIDLSNIEA